jgi:hypothetical protein
VRHPEVVAIPQTPHGRELVVYAETTDPDTAERHLIALGLILEIVVNRPTASQSPG